MRYPQGGGLTVERQQFREELRLKAAERFALGEGSSAIARDLRVSVRSVQRWRHAWAEDGPRSLRSQGPASLPRLSEKQFTQLEAELAKGPTAHGWEDQRWTLSRVRTVIGRRFHLTYTIQGVRKLLVRNGWSCQVPARRAMERDDDAVAVGQGGVALRGRLAAARGAWLVFEDEAGFSMTPPHAKTWSPRGRTPVVRVRGRSRRRISIAALTCYKPGHRSRLIYRPRRDDGNRDGRKSFSWRDYRDLLIAAHQQLDGPIVLVWDNLNVHKAAGLRKFAEARDWLTIYYLPPYAPDLNPAEGIWSLLRRGWLSNVAFSTPEHLVQTIRHGLRHIQYRSNLIDGCLTETGLTIRPPNQQHDIPS
ncbi:IS630 family transposase [Streptomyces sp. NBC_01237]|uniref:IS630 family transposase n=1 Tax=Streptomyces sp. NBC_01237 TaxID=2903790 RepID=UPI003FA36DE9